MTVTPNGIRATALVSALLWGLCGSRGALGASAKDVHTTLQRPSDTIFNQGAGRGDYLFLEIRVGEGEKQLFILDTGLTHTVLDKTLEPGLGKRLGTQKAWFPSCGGWKKAGVYRAPKLYLGDCPLQTGRKVRTLDFRQLGFSNRPVRGILGMDCLQNYCVQLDFSNRKLRFLDPDHLESQGLGQSRPLSSFFREISFKMDFCGQPDVKFFLDTGWYWDGALRPDISRRTLQRCTEQGIRAQRRPKTEPGGAVTLLSSASIGNLIYTNLALNEFSLSTWFHPMQNVIGLRFLARHLVTLNFPKGRMFLLRRNEGPLDDERPALIEPGDYHMAVQSEMGSDGYMHLASACLKTNESVVSLKDRGTIVLLHDYNRQKEDMVLWGFTFAQAGFRVVMPDLRGHGASSGARISYGKYESEDLRQIMDQLVDQRLCPDRVGVLGFGLGADVALQWAARDKRVATVVAVGPSSSRDAYFARMATEARAVVDPSRLRAAVELAASQIHIHWPDWSGNEAVRQLRVPVLFVGGQQDTVSPPSEVKELAAKAPHGSDCRIIQGLGRSEFEYCVPRLGESLKVWFSDHLSALTCP